MNYSFESVPLSIRKTQSFNLRWAELPDNVIPLTAADVDFEYAPEIKEYLVKMIESGFSPYSPAAGISLFRESFAQFYQVQKQYMNISPEQVIATNSAAAAIETVYQFLLQPGDEIIVQDPVDFLLAHCAEKMGVIVQKIPNHINQFWDEWESQISSKTKALVWCHPNNPEGLYSNPKDLKPLIDLARKYRLPIISDEVWSDWIWNQPFESIANYYENTFTVYGFSKGFGLAGFRIGAIITPNHVITQQILSNQGYERTINGVSAMSQYAAIGAMKFGLPWQNKAKEIVKENLQWVISAINQTSILEATFPEATFLAWATIKNGVDSEQLAKHIQEKFGIACVPGKEKWFGPSAENHLRFSCAFGTELRSEIANRISKIE
jgi:aspartate/methionine/tyrosine aminotransferase